MPLSQYKILVDNPLLLNVWVFIFIRPVNQKRKEQKRIRVQVQIPLTMMMMMMTMMMMTTIRVVAPVALIPRMIRVKRKTQVTKLGMEVVVRGKLIKGKITSTRKEKEMLTQRKAHLQGIRKARQIKAQAPRAASHRSFGGTLASPGKNKNSTSSKIKAILMNWNGQKKGRGRPPKILSQLADKTKKKLAKPKMQLVQGQIVMKRPRGRPPKYPRPLQMMVPQTPTTMPMKSAPKKVGRPRKHPRPEPPGTSTATPTSFYSTITQALNSRSVSGPGFLQKSVGLIPSSVPRTVSHANTIPKHVSSTASHSSVKFPIASSPVGHPSTTSSDSNSSVPSSFNGDVNKNIIAPKTNAVDGGDSGKDSHRSTGPPGVGSLAAESRSLEAMEPAMEVRAFWKPPPEAKPLLDQVFITDVTSGSLTITIRESTSDAGFFKQRETTEEKA